MVLFFLKKILLLVAFDEWDVNNIDDIPNLVNSNSNKTSNKRSFDKMNTQNETTNSKEKKQRYGISSVTSNSDSDSIISHSSSTTTPVTSPVTPVTDNESLLFLQYTLQKQNEANHYPDYNVIANPLRPLQCLEKAPWILKFEIARFVTIGQVVWKDLSADVIQNFLDVGYTNPTKLFDTMLNWYSQYNSSTPGNILNGNIWKYMSMERCHDIVWKYAGLENSKNELNLFDSSNQQPSTPNPESKLNKSLYTRAIHFSAKIVLSTNDIDGIAIRLLPPHYHASNRFFRKFGSDRFLELRLPKKLPPNFIQLQSSYILKPILLMGRTFKFLFIKDDRLVYFATKGNQLAPISIRDVVDWHIPIITNWGMAVSKFASRMALGYSNSIPALTFKKENIRYIDDIYSESAGNEETCMTDGCGLISASAIKKIIGAQQNDILPCAVQGRIGGAKGVWIVPPNFNEKDGDWISIRESQNKFKTGLPGLDLETDPLHFTFDLVKITKCTYPSHLNTQFIQCLSSGGVPIKVFIELLKEQVESMTQTLTDNQNVRILRDWLVKSSGLMLLRSEIDEHSVLGYKRHADAIDDIDDDNESNDIHDNESTSADVINAGMPKSQSTRIRFNKYSGHPTNIYEIIIRLIDAGFDLTNAFLAEKITHIFRHSLKSISVKYRLEVQQSCTLMCIPDPTGTLKPNEIFLQLSNRKVDEKTGFHAGLITGDVLVTRNPCGLKSDIQKVRAVDCPSLRLYSDVVVFPIQGERSLASKLGGGDYDGDLIFCCWEPRIVESFFSSPVPDTMERVEDAFEKSNIKMSEEISHLTNMAEQEATIQKIFLNVPIYDGSLGQYENWRTIISEMTSLETPDAIYLAQMCAKLVDAPKQGLKIKKNIKNEDWKRFGKGKAPKWFITKLNSTRDSLETTIKSKMETIERTPTTAMDHLYDTLFQELKNLSKRSKTMFNEENVIRIDTDLTAPWNRAQDSALALNDKDFINDLDSIRKLVDEEISNYQMDVRQVCEYLASREEILRKQKQLGMDNSILLKGNMSASVQSGLGEHLNKCNSLYEAEEYHAKIFFELMLTTVKSQILKADVLLNDSKFLQSIKASYAYIATVKNWKYSKYCYVVAFDYLCRIKADAIAKRLKPNGLCHSINQTIYPALTMYKKWVRKDKESYKNQNK
ncbi:unnamed protein product [Cunninghamella blakesleeana]